MDFKKENFDNEGGRFAHVVQQNRQGERCTRLLGELEQQAGVNKNVAFRVKLWWLLHTLHGGNLGQDHCQNS